MQSTDRSMNAEVKKKGHSKGGIRSGHDLGGVNSLERFMMRCTRDEDSGCLIWYRDDLLVHIMPGILGCTKKTKMSAGRAAWLFSGREIKEGSGVYRAFTTCHSRCCDPEHGAALSPAQHGALVRRQKRQIGMITKINGAKKAAQHRLTAPEVVQQIEASISDGNTLRAVVDKHGVSMKTVINIKRGLHPNGTKHAQQCLPNASIFSLATSRRAA